VVIADAIAALGFQVKYLGSSAGCTIDIKIAKTVVQQAVELLNPLPGVLDTLHVAGSDTVKVTFEASETGPRTLLSILNQVSLCCGCVDIC